MKRRRGCLLALLIFGIFVGIAVHLMGPFLNGAEVHREIAKGERVSNGQVQILDWHVEDGWSDGADVFVRYRVCDAAKRCRDKEVNSAFQWTEADRWEMTYPDRMPE